MPEKNEDAMANEVEHAIEKKLGEHASGMDDALAQKRSELTRDGKDLERGASKAESLISRATSSFRQAATHPVETVGQVAEKAATDATAAIHDLTDPEVRRAREEERRAERQSEKLTRKAERQRREEEERSKKLAEEKRAAEIDAKRLPIWMKVFGVLCMLGACSSIPGFIDDLFELGSMINDGQLEALGISSMVITIVHLPILVGIATLYFVLGIRLVRNKRRYAAVLCYTMYAFIIGGFVCSLMLYGVTYHLALYLISGIILIAVQAFLDPALRDERKLQRKLRAREDLAAAEAGTLGRDPSGKGYIELNFFNLFFVFIFGCLLGIVIEEAWHVIVVVPGEWQSRTSLLWGQWSTLYGAAAVIMTIALNNFYKKSPAITLVAAVVISMLLESASYWVMKLSWGVTAWHYSNPEYLPLLGGSTCVVYGVMFGVCGVFFLRVCLPLVLKLANLIPWNLRYTVVTIFAAFMIANIGMTMIAIDCWQQRVSGQEPATPIAQFCADNYDDEWMTKHFATMKIEPRTPSKI